VGAVALSSEVGGGRQGGREVGIGVDPRAVGSGGDLWRWGVGVRGRDASVTCCDGRDNAATYRVRMGQGEWSARQKMFAITQSFAGRRLGQSSSSVALVGSSGSLLPSLVLRGASLSLSVLLISCFLFSILRGLDESSSCLPSDVALAS
jgi:hypothetical protein